MRRAAAKRGLGIARAPLLRSTRVDESA